MTEDREYRVVIEIGIEHISDQTNPMFRFNNWLELKAFVDTCIRNGYDVTIKGD